MSTGKQKSRLERRFAALAAAGRGGLVAFVTAGDPDAETALALVAGLPAAGADVIELGMPFSDPMADGPAVQASSQRALAAGMTLAKTIDLVRGFRATDQDTPIVLMGYYNPIYSYGVERFLKDAVAAGLHWIRLATPTTDDARLPAVLANTGGFLYYVSVMGITGTRSATGEAVRQAVSRLKRHTDLPIAVGFGIKTPAQAAEVAAVADAAVVGSALVERIRANLDARGRAKPGLVEDVLGLVGELAQAVRGARQQSGTAKAKSR